MPIQITLKTRLFFNAGLGTIAPVITTVFYPVLASWFPCSFFADLLP